MARYHWMGEILLKYIRKNGLKNQLVRRGNIERGAGNLVKKLMLLRIILARFAGRGENLARSLTAVRENLQC